MLLDQLIERQKRLDLTDEQFAVVLGVSRQLWQKTRTKEQRIGESVIRGVTNRFPELQGAVLIFLQGRATVTSANATETSTPEESDRELSRAG